MKKHYAILDQVFATIGSANQLAIHLGISRQAVHQWRAVPLKYIKEISKLTKIPREKLRPDIYD